jgi:hypothetical protein
MDKNEVLKILETAKDKNGEVPMRLVRQAFEKLPESCEDTISRRTAIKTINKVRDVCDTESLDDYRDLLVECFEVMPPAQPEIVRCCKCSYWDRDSLRHQCNDFRDWNEAECKILAERDPYDEINRYTEADDYCSRAERRTDG